MATERAKILGQAALGATTLTDVYIVPSTARAVVSSYVVCNRGATSTTFRVSVSIGGQADSTAQYVAYDCVCPANDQYVATIGATLGPKDVVRAYAGNANLSVNVFGVEIGTE